MNISNSVVIENAGAVETITCQFKSGQAPTMSLEKRGSDETWSAVSGDGIGVSQHFTNHDLAKIGYLYTFIP